MVGRASIAVVGPTLALEDALRGLYDVTRDTDAEGVEQTQRGGDGDQTTRYTCIIGACDGRCLYQGTLIRMLIAG